MRCPVDSTYLLKNDSNKPLYQCSDCSGVFVSRSTDEIADTAILDVPLSTLSCPKDGARLHLSNAHGVALHLCDKCGSAWLDGDAQERLLSKTPNWFGKPVSKTPGAIAGGLAIEAIITIFMG